MDKAKTSKKPRKSVKKFLKVHTPFSSKELKDPKVLVEALLDCIKSGDLEAFQEVLIAHLMTVNKSEIAKRSGVGRRTLYDLMDPKKEFNPSLATLAAVIRSLAA